MSFFIVYCLAVVFALYLSSVLHSYQVYKTASGFSLFKLGRVKLELWYFPRGFWIKEHKHPHEYIKTIKLFGTARFYRTRLGKTVFHEGKWFNYKRFMYNIKPNDSHWFFVSNKIPMLALNIERWTTDKVTSASKDIEYV